ncbi:hypothetical protein L2E82_49071 [Cichorium intybus]|uniref:Uncharacterized protein n=1 Tax=Cichorium intybus TaxID=13427 RepID=A0ACB8YZN6_CICIN|nr:hypothetical protein L2E82_49071 [Cichorium intybus]
MENVDNQETTGLIANEVHALEQSTTQTIPPVLKVLILDEKGSSDDEIDLLVDNNNILDEPEVDISAFISVVSQDVKRDPNTIPIPESFGNEDDESDAIDIEVFDIVGVEGEKRKQLLKDIKKLTPAVRKEVNE